MKYSIVIPSFNETNLNKLLNEITEISTAPIIVVDDFSKIPFSCNVLNENIHILRNQKNRGKGYSIKKGVLKSNLLNCDYSLTMDADSQHSPKDIVSFLDQYKKYDLIIGYRNFNDSMPFHRKLSNKITSLIISSFCKIDINDSQCGFRLYKNDLFSNYTFNEDGFQFESEVLLKIGNKIRIKQIPIKTIYNNNTSKINYFRDTYNFIKLILRYAYTDE